MIDDDRDVDVYYHHHFCLYFDDDDDDVFYVLYGPFLSTNTTHFNINFKQWNNI